MIFLHAIVLAAAAGAPTPKEYYTRALGVMNSLVQPSYATFDLDMRAGGAGIMTNCNPSTRSESIAIGWGGGMTHELRLQGEYATEGDVGAIMGPDRLYCKTRASLLKPEWAAMHDWMRYGLDGPPPRTNKSAMPIARQSNMPTIASVTAVAPAAYDIFEGGAATCPSGTPGHALHLVARSNPDDHPLTDVVIETQTMRFCMMRFRLFSVVIAGSGAKGDVVMDFGDNRGYWSITRGQAVFSLRMLGASLKHMQFDFAYSNFRYPATLPK